MLTGMLPVFATDTFWEIFLPTKALPKLTLAGFTWMAAIEFVPLAFTNPEQPLKNAAEELKITALAAHTHPLRLVFTVLISSGLCQLVSWGGGWGPAKIAARSCPIFASRIRGDKPYCYWYGEQFWCRGRSILATAHLLSHGQELIGR